MKNTILACILATLSACASITSQTADNREWTKVSCSGTAGWNVCSQKAEALCPNGFDIANKEEHLVTGLRAYSVACKK